MILSNELDSIAKLAYQRFVKTADPELSWEELPPSTQAIWRDRVLGADRMRKHKTLEIWEEDCALQAIYKWESKETASHPAETHPSHSMEESVKPKKTKKEKQ